MDVQKESNCSRKPGLQRRLTLWHVWATGVAAVITGEYFGWNLGLDHSTPTALLLAILAASLLYLALALTLTDVAVGLPTATGPLDLIRRVWGPSGGFLGAWSMFLGFQFAGAATALACGSYLAGLVQSPDPAAASHWAAVFVVLLVFAVQLVGVREQAGVSFALSLVAIAGILLFWALTVRGWTVERLFAAVPTHGDAWSFFRALPYGVWVLAGIEASAFAVEETKDPSFALPRGILLAQVTLTSTALVTCALACGSLPYPLLARGPDQQQIVDPLVRVVRLLVGGQNGLLAAFSLLSLVAVAASYHGIVFAGSRQVLAMARLGWLPLAAASIMPRQHTPVGALLVGTCITLACIMLDVLYPRVLQTTLLVSTMAALVWYVLAMLAYVCIRFRSGMARSKFVAPAFPVLQITAIAIALLTLAGYSSENAAMLPLAAILYTIGGAVYVHHRRQNRAAPSTTGDHELLFSRPDCQSDPPPVGFLILDYWSKGVLAATTLFFGWFAIAALARCDEVGSFQSAEPCLAVLLIASLLSVISASAAMLIGYRSRGGEDNGIVR